MTGNSAAASGFADYSVFGLRVRSEVALPELLGAEGEAPADVTIEVGEIEERELQGTRGEFMLTIPEVGRYRISRGSHITIDPEPNVPERNVRVFLLGSAFGALLHQRGLLPLHANAVEIDGQAIAFMGASGGGKSTLAAWFHDHGYRVLADDVCVVRFDERGNPSVAPGLPRLRLWKDALDLLGRDAGTLSRSYISDEHEKFDLPIADSIAAVAQPSLAAVFLLDRGDEFSIVPLHGIEAAEAIFANTYRGEYLAKTSGHGQHWESAVRLVRSTPVYRATREWGLEKLEAQYSRLIAHAKKLAARSGDTR